jgi:hypothetical protein
VQVGHARRACGGVDGHATGQQARSLHSPPRLRSR